MAFEYSSPAIPEGHIKIKPSGIANFWNYPSSWYKDTFLGEQTFKGNTASELGSVIHELADKAAGNEYITRTEVNEYIDSIDNEDVDKQVIKDNWYEMSELLINQYVLRNIPDLHEHSMQLDLGDSITMAGTLDGYYNSGIVNDYKSTGKKPKTDAISWNHWVQLMAYAKMLVEEGKEVNRLRITWIVRPTATLPARLFVVNHEVTDKDWKEFDDILKIMVDTIKLSQSQPELNHVLFKSMNLES